MNSAFSYFAHGLQVWKERRMREILQLKEASLFLKSTELIKNPLWRSSVFWDAMRLGCPFVLFHLAGSSGPNS
jgi:hypothetical protein